MSDWTPEELAELKRKQPKCQDCGKRLTWDARRRQFARLVNKGWAADLIRSTSVLPRCQKCLTKWLHSYVGGKGEAGEASEIGGPDDPAGLADPAEAVG